MYLITGVGVRADQDRHWLICHIPGKPGSEDGVCQNSGKLEKAFPLSEFLAQAVFWKRAVLCAKGEPRHICQPGNMDTMVPTEDQIRKGQQGSKEEVTRRKRGSSCQLACLFVGGEMIWTVPKEPRVTEEAGSHGLLFQNLLS